MSNVTKYSWFQMSHTHTHMSYVTIYKYVKCQNIHMMSAVKWLTSKTRMVCVVLVMTFLMLLWAGPAVSLTQGLLVLYTQGKGVKIHLYQDIHNVTILLVNVKHDIVSQEMVIVCKTDRTKRLNHHKKSILLDLDIFTQHCLKILLIAFACLFLE